MKEIALSAREQLLDVCSKLELKRIQGEIKRVRRVQNERTRETKKQEDRLQGKNMGKSQ